MRSRLLLLLQRRHHASSSSRFIGQPTHATHPHLLPHADDITRNIQRHEFALRRSRLCQSLLSSDSVSAVILVSNDAKYFSHDANFQFRQNSTFAYLFGFLEPQSVAVLIPSTEEWFLFCREHDPVKEMWDGPICGPKRALEQFQCANTFGIDMVERVLPALLPAGHTCVVSCDPLFSKQVDAKLLTRVQTTVSTSDLSQARSVLSLVDLQRVVKSPSELECIRLACAITGQGHVRAMQHRLRCRTEAEMQAEVEYGFARTGDAEGTYYQSIVAGGARACTLHYTANDMIFISGELCLIDAGARLLGAAGYGGDVTRTFPVGRANFTQEERCVYLAVFDCLEHVLSLAKPGVTMQDLHLAAVHRLHRNLNKAVFACTMDDIKRYFPHGIGHYMGLDVHDTPTVGRQHSLQPGTVITVEPGLYFAVDDLTVPLKYRGIGIRLEDNCVINSEGEAAENLTRPHVPVHLELVEALGS